MLSKASLRDILHCRSLQKYFPMKWVWRHTNTFFIEVLWVTSGKLCTTAEISMSTQRMTSQISFILMKNFFKLCQRLSMSNCIYRGGSRQERLKMLGKPVEWLFKRPAELFGITKVDCQLALRPQQSSLLTLQVGLAALCWPLHCDLGSRAFNSNCQLSASVLHGTSAARTERGSGMTGAKTPPCSPTWCSWVTGVSLW